MENVTIISYPAARNDELLSLTEARSRYMIPFGGRFRVVDFTLRNSWALDAESTIIYSNIIDGLDEYITHHNRADSVTVVSEQFSDLQYCHDLIEEHDTSAYILYNGENPSIIDFSAIMKRFRASKSDSLLFLIDINGKPSMANKLLVTRRRKLLKVINRVLKEGHTAPNIFEMLMNFIINSGVKRATYRAHYWPMKNVPDYFNSSREVIWNQEIFDLLYEEKIIQSGIESTGYAVLGEEARVSNSFVSDYCSINGTVENSIVYPGVVIEEKAVVRDSIILPFARIAPGARITRTVVDERTDRSPEDVYPNIGPYCNIGTEEESFKSNDYPRSLFNSITVIGKDCRIPERSNIGGACYVASGLGEDFFLKKKYLYDGLSVV